MVAPAVLSCVSTTAPLTRDSGPPIQTEDLIYKLEEDSRGWSVNIDYTYQNRTGGTVYIVNCNGSFALRLERFEEGEWRFAWGPVLPQCLSPAITIAPGGTYGATLRVWGAPPETRMAPQFTDDDPAGLYRIVWIDALSSFQDRLPFGEQLAFDHRVSNQFNLTR